MKNRSNKISKSALSIMLMSASLSMSFVGNLYAQTLSDDLANGKALTLSVGVSGQVAKVLVTPGDEVKAGQLLLSLQTRHYQSALNAAAATLDYAKFKHQLQQDNFARQQELYEEGSLSTVELQQTELATKQTKSQLAAARASYQAANQDLLDANIHAPIDGEILAVPIVGQRVNVQTGAAALIKMKGR